MNNIETPDRESVVRNRKAEVSAQIEALVSKAERSDAQTLGAEDTAAFNRLCEESESLNRELERFEADRKRAAAFADSQQRWGTANGLARAYVERESGPYTPRSAENGGASFFRDMARARRGDYSAIERLHRNNQHVSAYSTRAALTTVNGAGGEFVPPLWLEQDFLAFLRPGRPAWELTTQNALPQGTDSLNIPKVNAGTAVALQGTQNTAIQETDLTTTSVSSGVVTVAGGQTVSMQLVEQSPVNIDRVVLEDLARAYAVQCDTFVLNGSGTSGQPLGILNVSGTNAVTFTSTTPAFISTTAANSFYNTLVNAINQIRVNRFASPDAIVMHPRRWSWCLEALDGQQRPVVLTDDANPMNAAGIAEMGAPAQSRVGTLLGIPVYLDASMPTNLGAGNNQDPVIVARLADVWTWEGNVRAEAFEQTIAQNLSMFFRLYNYISVQAGRYPQALSVINGTGLVAPTL